MILFFIGLIWSIKKYREKRSINSLVLVFLMFQSFLFNIINLIVYFTDWLNIFPIFNSFGVLFFFVMLIILNIRLEKKVEERTKEAQMSEEKYRNLVLNIVDVILELDSELWITYISPQIKKLLNFRSKEVESKTILNFIHPEDRNKVERTLKRTLKKQTNATIECRMQMESGEYRFVSIRSSFVQDTDPKLIGVIRDVTKEKKAEKILREQYKKLKDIDKMRTDLVRRTTHELKTPLISLFSSSQHILETYSDKLNNDILRFIKIINRGGKRLKQLTDNFLDAYNIQARKLVLNKERFNLVKSIRECANDLIFSLEQRDLFLKEDLPDTFTVNADKSRIEQVILNLLSNAIKNTPPKGLILIKLESTSEYAEIIFKDTGIGLTLEEKKNLFTKFGKIERKDVNTELDTDGSGLGLFISKEIVELHGGKILVSSEGRNQGSTFTVQLPINQN